MGTRESQNRGLARIAVLFAAMLAVLLHALVVQPHVHAAPRMLTSALYEDAAAALPAQAAVVLTSNVGHLAACAVCEVLTTAGQMTPSPATAIPLAVVFPQQAAALAIALAPRALTHSWRSRAPPAPL